MNEQERDAAEVLADKIEAVLKTAGNADVMFDAISMVMRGEVIDACTGPITGQKARDIADDISDLIHE
jgi:hypothetical protein